MKTIEKRKMKTKKISSFLKNQLFILFLLFGQTAFSFSIGTYNLWHGLTGKGLIKMGELETDSRRKNRKNHQIDFFKSELSNLDIIFLQEVNPVDFSEKLAEVTNKDFIKTPVNCGVAIGNVGFPTNLKSGLAILASKNYQIKLVKNLNLSGGGVVNEQICLHTKERRSALISEVILSNKKDRILLVNLHLHHKQGEDPDLLKKFEQSKNSKEITEDEYESIEKQMKAATVRRKEELKVLASSIEPIKKEYKGMIVGGDFNIDYYKKDNPDMVLLKEFARKFNLEFSMKNENKKRLYTWNQPENKNENYTSKFPHGFKDVSIEVEKILVEAMQSPKTLDFFMFSSNLIKGKTLKVQLIGTKAINFKSSSYHLSDHFGILVSY